MTRPMVRGAGLVLLLALAGCTGILGQQAPLPRSSASSSPASRAGEEGGSGDPRTTLLATTSWVYQLQAYEGGRLDALARAPQQLAVIDLARDAGSDYFRPDEIAALKASGKRVLAYFEIGSIENYRPEYPRIRSEAGDLVLNKWPDWPQEYFVRYWDERWWDRVIAPRVDQALRAGFDGVYLDTPLAYEELDLGRVPGESRDGLARKMADLVIRLSEYAKARNPQFLLFPQNSPELRHQTGYTEAIDGIGMEELFFLATDEPCVEDYCAENLAETRALRDAAKLVLAVDYADDPGNIATACARYRTERFAGYVGPLALDRVGPPCDSK